MFDAFSDNARMWAYGFDVRLNPNQFQIVKEHLDAFCQNWQVHGKPVRGAWEMIENQIVMLVTDDDVSGCSIDSSVAVFKELKMTYGLNALDPNLVFFRSKRGIEAVSRPEFQVLVAAGEIDDDTIVFDMTCIRLGDARQGKFERPFKESWHANAFSMKTV